MSVEKMNLDEIEGMEAEIKARREGYNNRETVQHHGSVEDLSTNEIEGMEAEIKARREGYNNKETVQHHGSVEDLSASEIEGMESEIKARREGYNNRETVQHYGSVEDLSASEIEGMEAEIKARREGYNNRETVQHYGSVENLDEAEISIMEAQVAEKRKQDIPYKEYFNNLINNPDITDQKEFESAVLRSMQSNGVMRKFVDDLCNKIGDKTFELKNTDKNDKDKIENVKQEIEKMVAVYQRYMYTLKENQWDFSDLHTMKMPEYVTDNLWQQQKRLDVVFKMPIPVDLGEDYGKKFERDGKMIPGFELMYQDLSGKKVNWHQVMIYKENELTPKQRFLQRQKLKMEFKEVANDGRTIEAIESTSSQVKSAVLDRTPEEQKKQEENQL